MPPNPDFKHSVAATELTKPIHDIIAPHLGPLHPAIGDAAAAVAAHLDDRDRALEDYLNRNVVRRTLVENLLGDGTSHTSLTFVDVAPACVVAYQKASARSLLLCTVGVTGLYIDLGPPGYVDIGVHVEGVDGYDEQFGIARTTGRISGTEMTHAASKSVAGDCPSGPVTVTLQVQVQQGGEAWQSTNNDTISLTVTEVPLP